MIVLVSPTKTQKAHQGESTTDSLFIEKSSLVLDILKSYSEETLKKNMKISDKIAHQVFENYKNYDESNIAIQTYQGSSFKAMSVASWSLEDKDYANKHLRILSAVYGVLQPFDRIGLYRLDFLNTFEFDLYPFWQNSVTTYFNTMNQPILNLASKEYSKMINEQDLNVPLIKVDFKEKVGDTYVSKSTYAKVARGTMTRTIIQNQIQTIAAIKLLSFDGYTYNEALSTAAEIIFTR